MVYFSSKNYDKHLFFSTLTTNYLSLRFLIVLIGFFYLFFNSFAFAQSETIIGSDSIQTTDSTSLDSALLAQKIKSKFSIGFRAGVTNGRFEIANPETNDRNSSNLGSVITIFTIYQLNSNFSVQPELAIGRYRSNNTLYNLATLQGTIDYAISTFDLNLMGVYTYPITNRFSVSAEAGFSAALLTNSFGQVVAPNNVHIGANYDVNSDNQFEKLNYGAIIGINPSFSLKHVTLQTSIRYRHGLNNINTFDYRFNRYLANPERTIKTRDILFQVGFLIPIYKGRENGD